MNKDNLIASIIYVTLASILGTAWLYSCSYNPNWKGPNVPQIFELSSQYYVDGTFSIDSLLYKDSCNLLNIVPNSKELLKYTDTWTLLLHGDYLLYIGSSKVPLIGAWEDDHLIFETAQKEDGVEFQVLISIKFYKEKNELIMNHRYLYDKFVCDMRYGGTLNLIKSYY